MPPKRSTFTWAGEVVLGDVPSRALVIQGERPLGACSEILAILPLDTRPSVVERIRAILEEDEA